MQSVPAGEIRDQLARVLASRHFVPSPRLCRFLRFVVERTLEQDGERLKEFVVAMEVFDRNEDYDPNIDSIVRVEARRLRSKLKAYYDAEGSSDPILIGIRPGGYVPFFQELQKEPTHGEPRAECEYTTVAVLPFVNMSPEPEQDYFCDGITEEIINALTSLKNTSVVARTSAFMFKGAAVDVREVGERLGAQVVVEGSVRKAGNQLRITAQAIDAGKGYHLWSETYRRELQDVFAIQEEISLAIANTLRTKLPERGTRAAASNQPDVDAYIGFLRGMFLVHQQSVGGLYAAQEQFQSLIRQHPNYAQPYAGLAAVHLFLSLFGAISGKAVMQEVRRNAQNAVRLDPNSADAWAALGAVQAHWDHRWEAGEQSYRRAIELQPSNPEPRAWYAMMMARQARFDEAEAQLARVTELNPLAAADHTRMAYVQYLRGDNEGAMARCEKALGIEGDFAECRLVLGLLLIRQQKYEDAVAVLSKHLERFPRPIHMGLMAAAYAKWKHVDRALALVKELEALSSDRYVTPLATAYAYVGLGDADRAFTHIEAAVEDRTLFVDFLAVDTFYEPLRGDARFSRLLQTLNLTR